MGCIRPDGLRQMGLAVYPDWHKALKEYAAYKNLTMTHVIIDAVSRRMQREGYWPRRTAEEKERRRLAYMKRKTEARKRQAQGDLTPGVSHKTAADKKKRHGPSRIAAGRAGRSIGGRGGKPIRESRSNLFTA